MCASVLPFNHESPAMLPASRIVCPRSTLADPLARALTSISSILIASNKCLSSS